MRQGGLRPAAAALAVVGLTTALAACGGDDGEEPAGTSVSGMEYVRGACAQARAKGEVRVRAPLGQVQALARAEQGLVLALAIGAERVPDRRVELLGLRAGHQHLLELYLRPAAKPREARAVLRDGMGFAQPLAERAQSAGLPECAPPKAARPEAG